MPRNMYRAHYKLFEISGNHLLLKKIEYSYIPRNIEKKLKSKKGTRDMHAILSNNHVQPISKQK
jgi:hypothetical protein